MTNFKIATWNVNSLRVRLPHLLAWLKSAEPNVIALQETKLPDADFPLSQLTEAGYAAIFSGQRTYNGVALLSRNKMTDMVTDVDGFLDPQRRILAGTVGDIRVINVYVPNGQCVDSEKYHYKLTWLEHMTAFIAEQLKTHPKLIVLGDFNIAPQLIDVHDPAMWEGKVLFSEPERALFSKLLNLGLIDSFRQFSPDAKAFSWWDYRLFAFKRNLGLRIDHILISNALHQACRHCYIDITPRAWERPSDHAPVIAEFNL
jgi:exodeoxyribonuclease III